jgi:hypothetical protein
MLERLLLLMAIHLHLPNFPTKIFCLSWVLVFSLVRPAQAEMTADLLLDDPKALLSSHPEGLAQLPPRFASSTATIASGKGGRVLPQITAGPASEKSDGNADVNLRMISAPPLGASPFFQATLEGGATTRQAGVGIILDKETSLDALVIRDGKSVKISGGFDFLFRTASSSDFPKVSVLAKAAHLGVVAGIDPKNGKLVLRLNTNGKSLDTNGDQAGDRAQIEKRSEAGIENGGIYHGAVLFQTAEDGSLTVSFLAAEGAGPLDPSASISVSIEGIWLLDEPAKSGNDKIVITLGRSETSRQTLDLAVFRVFRQVPEPLPGFEAAGR